MFLPTRINHAHKFDNCRIEGETIITAICRDERDGINGSRAKWFHSAPEASRVLAKRLETRIFSVVRLQHPLFEFFSIHVRE